MIDFSLSQEQQDLRERVETFVREKVVPFEKDKRIGFHGPSDELQHELRALAR